MLAEHFARSGGFMLAEYFASEGYRHLVVTFRFGGEEELDLAVLTNVVGIHCSNLRGLAFRPACLWLIARRQVDGGRVSNPALST